MGPISNTLLFSSSTESLSSFSTSLVPRSMPDLVFRCMNSVNKAAAFDVHSSNYYYHRKLKRQQLVCACSVQLMFQFFLILGLFEKTVPKVLKSCGLKKCSLKLHYKTDPSTKAENHQHKPLKDCKDQKLTQCKNNKD